MRRQRCYVELNPSEIRLAAHVMIAFRNKLLEKGIDTVDVDRIILKLHGRKWRWR